MIGSHDAVILAGQVNSSSCGLFWVIARSSTTTAVFGSNYSVDLVLTPINVFPAQSFPLRSFFLTWNRMTEYCNLQFCCWSILTNVPVLVIAHVWLRPNNALRVVVPLGLKPVDSAYHDSGATVVIYWATNVGLFTFFGRSSIRSLTVTSRITIFFLIYFLIQTYPTYRTQPNCLRPVSHSALWQLGWVW